MMVVCWTLFGAAENETAHGGCIYTKPAVCACAGNAAYSGSSTSESLIVDLESSHLRLLITPDPAIRSKDTTFNVTITSGGPGSPGLAGKTITLDYGEFDLSDTNSSSAIGVAMFTHTYCQVGEFTVTATFAGAPPPGIMLIILISVVNTSPCVKQSRRQLPRPQRYKRRSCAYAHPCLNQQHKCDRC